MQFPVPQFTDVEDKIIAGLTFKQFAIVFATGVFTFIIYTISKNVVITIVAGVLTVLPGLVVALGKLNGRPIYSSAGNFVRFALGPKIYVYHKEAVKEEEFLPIKTEAQPKPKDLRATAIKIKELNYLLEQQQSEEDKLIEIIKQNQNQPGNE